MPTRHAPGFSKPFMTVAKSRAPLPIPASKPAIVLKPAAPPPASKPLGATIVLKTDGAAKATPVGPSRADARVIAAGTIVLHRRDVPRGPLFAVGVTKTK